MRLPATYSTRPNGRAALLAAVIAATALATAPGSVRAQVQETSSAETSTSWWDRLEVAAFGGAREGYTEGGKIYDWSPVYGAEATMDVGGGFFAMLAGRYRSAVTAACPENTACTLDLVRDPGETMVSAALGWRYRGPVDLGVHAGPAWVLGGFDQDGLLAGLFLDVSTPVERLAARVGIDTLLRYGGDWERNFRDVHGLRFGGGLTLRAGLAFRP